MVKKRIFLAYCSQILLILCLVSTNVCAQDSESDYIENIRNYIDSIRTYRFKAEFKGIIEQGVQNFGQIKYDMVSNYELLFDQKKELWKIKINEDRVPRGEYNEQAFKKLHLSENKTVSKSKTGFSEYFHKEMEGGNYAVLYGDHASRGLLFRYQMQRLDPTRYISLAIPSSKCVFEKMEHVKDKVILTYKIKGILNGYNVVELSKYYDYLPVRIYNKGDGWNLLKKGKYKNVSLSIEYESSENGYVVSKISYKNASGEGLIKYNNVKYNSEIEDNEFHINIPSDAMILNHEGKVLAYHSEIDKILNPTTESTTDVITAENEDNVSNLGTSIEKNDIETLEQQNNEFNEEKADPEINSDLSDKILAENNHLFPIIICIIATFGVGSLIIKVMRTKK